ncbi:tol-pal system-associated acyl-CoA thioesterase [Paraburkholderia sp. NMBU_R16]|uniref:tol-pal system-associated acyl-CoA thioesterase n=1 Tax=Paraburkholderia sp. NMBU_R16 TaxID=2698676 RepID=UPI001565D17B|nr:tol-pal system-associated acyl-CoA thioesterase [Paraburkholderia sp. NMBU_R16]NRO95788.1 tol-pal system-associated acyl-CoA thioesterase [Paraburkholderia sp. NMBU_R16]
MNMPSSRPATGRGFLWPLRVYYEDTDAGGIVFYANYLKFFERARTEWLRACGIEQGRLDREIGIVFVVRGTSLDYRAPARLDDLLTIESHIERLGRASVDFVQHAWCESRLLATGEIRVACVERATFKPAPIPPEVLAALRRGPGVVHAGMSTADA